MLPPYRLLARRTAPSFFLHRRSIISVPSLLSLSAAAKEGGMTSFARSITFVLGVCRSALSLSFSLLSLPVVANANPFLAMTCTVRTHERMEGAFISTRMCHARQNRRQRGQELLLAICNHFNDFELLRLWTCSADLFQS